MGNQEVNMNSKITSPKTKIVGINKVGRTELVLDRIVETKSMCIDNFNCPFNLLTPDEQDARRYIGDKFTETCDRYELNVRPGVEYVYDDKSDKTVRIEVVGIKITPDTESDVFEEYTGQRGYKMFNVFSIIERYPDGHGDWENTDYIYDEHGEYIRDEEGNSIHKKWSYRFNKYMYFYKEI